MHQHLQHLALSFEFVKAVDGSELPTEMAKLYSATKSRETIGRELLLGEIGCALSHYKIYRRMLLQGFEAALIIEDDVALSQQLVSVLNCALQSNQDWELLNLITDVDEKVLANNSLPAPYAFTSFLETPNRTGAYLLRASGAQKLADAALPVRMAADSLTGDVQGSGLVLRGVFPSLATLRPLKSTFQRGNYPPKSIVWERKVSSAHSENVVTLNEVLTPSQAWVFWHTMRSYLGPLKRASINALRLLSSRA